MNHFARYFERLGWIAADRAIWLFRESWLEPALIILVLFVLGIVVTVSGACSVALMLMGGPL